MRANGKFIFKSLTRVDGGEFVNEKGQKVTYDSSYQLKVDEKVDNTVMERKLKIPQKYDSLIQKLMKKNCYDPIELVCDIQMYGSVAKVIPIDMIDSNNK